MRIYYIGVIVVGILLTACGSEQETEEAASKKLKISQAKKMITATDTAVSDWKIRLDYPAKRSVENISIEKTDDGYHIVSGPRAIYYKKGMSAQIPYTLSARFTQNGPAGMEAYGLFVGGQQLQQMDQRYLYYLIRQNGQYLIKRRVGSETETIVDWTGHEAVKSFTQDSLVNRLAVKARRDSLYFSANGQVVHAIPTDTLSYTEGQTGLRINHRLDLSINNITLTMP